MDTQGNLSVTAVVLLITFILIGAVAGSILVNETQSDSAQDLNQITNEVVDEITTYIQIKNIYGKYETIQGKPCIQKIAILVKPLVSVTLDIAKITLMISTPEDLQMLSFSGQAASLPPNSLFNHPLWDSLNESTYGLLSIVDDDSSMTQYHVINKNTDMAFILLKLPAPTALPYGRSMQLTLTPSPGTTRTVTLEPPLPTTQIVTLY